jgi:peptide/nickel transport system ATP-binding protein
MKSPDPILEVKDLSIRFRGQPVDMIDRVSFSIAPGKTMCLVGESGCGKSVTSLTIMGLLPKKAATVTHGSARFQGRDVLTLPRHEVEDLRGDRIDDFSGADDKPEPGLHRGASGGRSRAPP